MNILSIETSCDETAVSVVRAEGGLESPTFTVLGNALFSQVDLHKKYGGVYPNLAKREHGKNLAPLLVDALVEAKKYIAWSGQYPEEMWQKISEVLAKENSLAENLKRGFDHISVPDIDMIAVAYGPGLEPALWVGISFAVALGILWNKPVVAVNHMEGHIASVLLNRSDEFQISNSKFQKRASRESIQFPALALLISGGHTELVKIMDWGRYEIIGETRDDAVGEAFDKVARMLGLPYPGGPEISRLTSLARAENLPHIAQLPRPMIHSHDFNFSFSGLKTAVLYYIRDLAKPNPEDSVARSSEGGFRALSEDDKKDIAREFEDAVIEVLLKKTKKAIEKTGAKTLIVAGGVISNKKLRETFRDLKHLYSDLDIQIPEKELATDNSVMIAMAGYLDVSREPSLLQSTEKIIARGNLKLH